MGVAGAMDSNGTSEDAGNSGGAQTVDMAKEVPGVYLSGAPQGGPNGLPMPMVITFKEGGDATINLEALKGCLLYTSPSPRDKRQSRMPSSA